MASPKDPTSTSVDVFVATGNLVVDLANASRILDLQESVVVIPRLTETQKQLRRAHESEQERLRQEALAESLRQRNIATGSTESPSSATRARSESTSRLARRKSIKSGTCFFEREMTEIDFFPSKSIGRSGAPAHSVAGSATPAATAPVAVSTSPVQSLACVSSSISVATTVIDGDERVVQSRRGAHELRPKLKRCFELVRESDTEFDFGSPTTPVALLNEKHPATTTSSSNKHINSNIPSSSSAAVVIPHTVAVNTPVSELHIRGWVPDLQAMQLLSMAFMSTSPSATTTCTITSAPITCASLHHISLWNASLTSITLPALLAALPPHLDSLTLDYSLTAISLEALSCALPNLFKGMTSLISMPSYELHTSISHQLWTDSTMNEYSALRLAPRQPL